MQARHTKLCYKLKFPTRQRDQDTIINKCSLLQHKAYPMSRYLHTLLILLKRTIYILTDCVV